MSAPAIPRARVDLCGAGAEPATLARSPAWSKLAFLVVTLAELELWGSDGEGQRHTQLDMRLHTLTRIREQTSGLPADDRVASAYARLAAAELQAGRKPRVHDTWIAATALTHASEVWTQDDDFTAFGGVTIVRL